MSAQPQSLAIVKQENKLTVTQEQLTLARQTVARDLDQSEFDLFCYNCQRLGVHPLDGMVVPIKRTDNDRGEKRLTFVITVDLLRSRAAESGEYAGSDDPTFEYHMKEDANLPTDAHCTVWRFVQGEKCSFSATARWEEYYPGEKQGFMWRNKPHVMLGKCSEALALRKGFPKQLAGLYIPEELQREATPTTRGKQQQQKTKPKDVGDVVCAHCGQKNSHAADCKYAQQCAECHAPAGKPHATGCSQQDKPETVEQKPEEKPKELKWLVQVDAVDPRKQTYTDDKGKKITREFLILSCLNAANEQISLYCWHTGETWKRLSGMKAGTRCIFMVKPQQSGEKTYYSIDSIVEITGEKNVQPELIPAEEKF